MTMLLRLALVVCCGRLLGCSQDHAEQPKDAAFIPTDVMARDAISEGGIHDAGVSDDAVTSEGDGGAETPRPVSRFLCLRGEWHLSIRIPNSAGDEVGCADDAAWPFSILVNVQVGALDPLPANVGLGEGAQAWYSDVDGSPELRGGEVKISFVGEALLDEETRSFDMLPGVTGSYQLQMPDGDWREGEIDATACQPTRAKGGPDDPACPELTEVWK